MYLCPQQTCKFLGEPRVSALSSMGRSPLLSGHRSFMGKVLRAASPKATAVAAGLGQPSLTSPRSGVPQPDAGMRQNYIGADCTWKRGSQIESSPCYYLGYQHTGYDEMTEVQGYDFICRFTHWNNQEWLYQRKQITDNCTHESSHWECGDLTHQGFLEFWILRTGQGYRSQRTEGGKK